MTGLTNSLCRAADTYPLDVVTEACQRLAATCKFPPTPAEMEEACALLNAALHPKVVEIYNGLLEMDWGHGRVDLRGLTVEDQDKIIALKGMMPDGRNAALLSLEEKREALNGKALPKGVKPRLRHM